MNKAKNIVLTLAAASMLAACGNTAKTGAAYGMTHGAGYISKATVTVDGGKVTDATLVEVCLPDYVQPASASADTVEATVKSHGADVTRLFWKTVKFGTYTLEFDATAKTYKSGSKTMVELFQEEKAAQTYYDAVLANNVSVMIGGKEDKTYLTNDQLNKEVNGYWKGDNYPLGWLGNRDATVKWVKEHGIDGLLSATKKTDGNKQWTVNGVDTGATWSDLASNTTGKNYLSYAQLLVNAFNNAK